MYKSPDTSDEQGTCTILVLLFDQQRSSRSIPILRANLHANMISCYLTFVFLRKPRGLSNQQRGERHCKQRDRWSDRVPARGGCKRAHSVNARSLPVDQFRHGPEGQRSFTEQPRHVDYVRQSLSTECRTPRNQRNAAGS